MTGGEVVVGTFFESSQEIFRVGILISGESTNTFLIKRNNRDPIFQIVG